MTIPPGLVYLFGVLPQFIAPPVLVRLALRWANLSGIVHLEISPWVIATVYVLLRIVLFVGLNVYRRWNNRRKAAALGAEVPPYVQKSSLAATKDLKHMVERGYPGDTLLKWTEEYGEVVLADLLTSSMLVTHEPSHVKALLATQFDSFGKSWALQETFQSLLGEGIFSANGNMWKFHRAITRPFFTKERISDFEIYERNSQMSLAAASQRLAEGYSIDVQDLFGRFTLDSATEFLFAQSVKSLEADLPYPPAFSHKNTESYYTHPSNVFVKAFTQGLNYTSARTGMSEEWRLFEFWGDKIKPLREVMDAFTQPIIDKALSQARSEEARAKGVDHKSIIASLVDQTQDAKILKDELINLLVAGRDTTMCLLSFSVYMLSQHPSIEHRLRREIFDIVGPSAAPTYDQMRELKYLRAFINEVLRLYPPVPVDERMAFHDVVLPSIDPTKKPIFVPKDTDCYYSVMNIHRRKDLWGPDALVFDPDRFIDERLHKYLTPNPFIFCPFNAGPRICLGQQFAYHEASYYMVRLLQRFTQFKLDESANTPPPPEWAHGEGRKPLEKIHPMMNLTMFIKGGLWVHMKELKNTGEGVH